MEEYNHSLYIESSKSSIDIFIRKKEYLNAFFLLLLVLERLDNNEKSEFIYYYRKNLTYLAIDISQL
jgi:hypothetical protein